MKTERQDSSWKVEFLNKLKSGGKSLTDSLDPWLCFCEQRNMIWETQGGSYILKQDQINKRRRAYRGIRNVEIHQGCILYQNRVGIIQDGIDQ